MRIGIMQPYLFPYLGYFQLINAVEKFVLLDDVQWIKGGWINRNRILLNNQPKMITLSVKKRSNYDNINQFEISEEHKNRTKFLNKIRTVYLKSEYFRTVFPILNSVVTDTETNLVKLILISLERINGYLGITTSILISSEIRKNKEFKSQEKVIEIVKLLKGNHYINAIGGQKLYSKDEFKKNNIKLSFIQMKEIKYKQFDSMFMPNLSIIDLMMFNSPQTIKKMLVQYNLI